MNDHFNFESLAETWKEQPKGSDFDAAKLKKQLFVHRLAILMSSILEFLILAVVIWTLIIAFNQSWPITTKLWLIFGLIAGLAIATPLLKSRMTSYKMLDLATQDWIKYQLQLSQQVLYRARLSRYFIVAFAVALGLFFIYEMTQLQNDLLVFGLRFSFGVLWLLAAWIINQRHSKKHAIFIKNHSTDSK